MTYYNIKPQEVSKKLVELEISNRKLALSLFDDIIKTLERFDGKQANKRIDTALKKINENLSFSREYNSFIINLITQTKIIKEF